MALNKTFESQWSFHRISRVMTRNVGFYIESTQFMDTFNNNTFKWKIYLYPNGRYKFDKNWLSVYVVILSQNGPVTATTSLSIVNKINQIIIHKSTNKTIYNTNVSSDTYWGFDQFVESDFVMDEENSVLDNDNLTIKFKIKLYVNNEEAATKVDEENEKDILRLAAFSEFERLIDEQRFSDVSFIIEGKIVRAHKCILTIRSSVFAAMFQHEMEEKLENTVKVEDMKYYVFLELLRFIYVGQVYDIETFARELYKAADKYDINGLKVVCKKALSESLSADNVITNLLFADEYDLYGLKEDAISFVTLHKVEMNLKPEFELLLEKPHLLFDLCKALMQDDS